LIYSLRRLSSPKLSFLGLLLVGLISSIVILRADNPPESPLTIGALAPNFVLRGLDGEEVTLENLRGKLIFLNFWATWCKPCEDEMPAMERLYDEFKDEEFQMLAVAVGDEPEDVRNFQKRLGLTFPILLDQLGKVSTLYQSFRFPETYWIDPNGRIVSRFIGPREWDDISYKTRLSGIIP